MPKMRRVEAIQMFSIWAKKEGQVRLTRHCVTYIVHIGIVVDSREVHRWISTSSKR
jgi:hypothetical protein